MNDTHKDRLMKYGALILLVATVYLAVLAVSAIKNYRYIGGGYGNVITVTGEGEVFAVPDIAQISFSVVEEKATLAEAQTAAAEKMNAIIAYLREQNIEERDIKTTGYNANPRYEYRNAATVSTPAMGPGVGRAEPAMMIAPGWGGNDTRVLVGYEIRQTISVKVRDTEKASTVVSGVGQLGVTDIYGPDFTIDDTDELQNEARELAIKEAREKAQKLARDLDVDLVRIVSFNEDGGGYYPMYAMEKASFDSAMPSPSVAPELPMGENRISSNVSITYEIR